MDKALVAILVACGSSTPPRAPKSEDGAVAAPADAAIDASVDAAAVADASIDAPVATQRPSPPSNVFRIIAIEERDGGTGIAIGAGSRQGIRDSWRAFLIDDNDRPVEDGDLVIKQISTDTTRCWSRLFVSRVRESYRRVRFEPR